MTTTNKPARITLADVDTLANSLTDARIRSLQAEAGAAGNTDMVWACRFALGGSRNSRREIAEVMLGVARPTRCSRPTRC